MQPATNLIVALACFSAALVLLQTGRADAAPMAAGSSQEQPTPVRESPETVDLFELSAAKAQQQQQQLVRRRRSSDQWPRHANLRQQKLASDAAFSQQLSVSAHSESHVVGSLGARALHPASRHPVAGEFVCRRSSGAAS